MADPAQSLGFCSQIVTAAGIAYYYVKTTSTNCKLYFRMVLARVLVIKLSCGLRKLLHFLEGPTTLEKNLEKR